MDSLQPVLKTRGQIEIIGSDGRSWKSPNFVIDLASQYVAKILEGTFTGTLYRMAIGNGGYSGLPPVRTLPNDGWYVYTGLQGSTLVSKPIAIKNLHTDGHVTSLTMQCVFASTDHGAGPADDDFNEACLILGSGTAGTQVGAANYMTPGSDVMYAYRTFDTFELPGPPAGVSTLTVNWTIFVENA